MLYEVITGGREIDQLAKEGDAKKIDFPRAKLKGNQLDFSFSGVKTALRQRNNFV